MSLEVRSVEDLLGTPMPMPSADRKILWRRSRLSASRYPPHALIDANGANPFWNQDCVDLLQLDGEETVKRVLELDTAIMAAPFSHCRRLRRETPAALG